MAHTSYFFHMTTTKKNHVDDIQSGKYKPGGISNAFAVRREKDQSDELQAMDSICTFCHPHCLSKRMWDAQVAIREECRRKMSCGGQWDGRTQHLHLKGLNREVFSHCHGIMKVGNEAYFVERNFSGEGPQKALNADLSNENVRMKQTVELVRAVEEPGMKRFKAAFGDLFAVANPTPELSII